MGEPACLQAHTGQRDGQCAAAMGLGSRSNRGDVGMGPLDDGLDRAGHHYERAGPKAGTLMRHFLGLALAPGALPGGVRIRPAVAALVACTGATHRLAPTYPRASPRAILVAAVATPADAHLLGAASAVVQPIALFVCRHAPTLHWTTPRIAGIKARQPRLTRARACRRPGVLPRICPGLRLSGVRDEHSACPAPRTAGDIRLSYLASAASTYNGVRFKSRGVPPLDPPEALARSNSAVNDSRGAAR